MLTRIRAAFVLSLVAAPAVAQTYAPDFSGIEIAMQTKHWGEAQLKADTARTEAQTACKAWNKLGCLDYRYLSAMAGLASEASAGVGAARGYYESTIETSADNLNLYRFAVTRNRGLGTAQLSADEAEQLFATIAESWHADRRAVTAEENERVTTNRMRQQGAADLAATAEKARQDAARARAEARSSGDGPGFLGTMMGAIGGGIAAGGKGAAALQGAIKGAQLAQGGSAAQQVYNELAAGHPTTMAPMAGAGMSVAGARPNVALQGSACAGFTEQNYRSKALSGGGDAQLSAMCGQAFEYYVAYKRALASGADASTTYKAHQDAAMNALSFYANNRAN